MVNLACEYGSSGMGLCRLDDGLKKTAYWGENNALLALHEGP